MNKSEQAIDEICRQIGVEINGNRPWDIKVYNERFYNRVIKHGSLGLGEAYMDGWWDADDIPEMFSRIMQNLPAIKLFNLNGFFLALRFGVLNLQTKTRSSNIADFHYDLGNDLFEATLGPYMQYTCNVWREDTKTIEKSEELKLKSICEALGLKAGDRVLDIGCGWGGFMNYAAKNYGVSCVGLSVSPEQKMYAAERCAGLPVEYILTDYRDYNDVVGFDHVVSIEMIEHVGPKNYRTFFGKANGLLKPEGRFFLQTIGCSHPKPTPGPWIDKYIFPDGVVTSIPRLEKAFRGLFIIDQIQDIGLHYEKTLISWWQQFSERYPTLQKKNPSYDKRFYRMWEFYLLMCAGMFRGRTLHDWQIVFSKSPRSKFSNAFQNSFTR